MGCIIYSLDRRGLNQPYTYSELRLNDEYVCDTLEFDSSLRLNSGEYLLKVVRGDISAGYHVSVIDDLGIEVSRIVGDNYYFNKGIRCRHQNNYISIGTRLNFSLLTNVKWAMKLLTTDILGYSNIYDAVKLKVID